MKKTIVIALAILIGITMLAACGETAQPEEPGEPQRGDHDTAQNPP